MIWSPVAAAVRHCVRFGRRRVAAPSAPPKLTVQQAAAILAPRPRIVRRAVALGCPAAALPTAAIPPVVPVPPVPPAEPSSIPLQLPFGIGTGPLLPTAFGAPPGLPVDRIYDVAGPAAAGVPEPASLAVLLVALAMLAAVSVVRHPWHQIVQVARGAHDLFGLCIVQPVQRSKQPCMLAVIQPHLPAGHTGGKFCRHAVTQPARGYDHCRAAIEVDDRIIQQPADQRQFAPGQAVQVADRGGDTGGQGFASAGALLRLAQQAAGRPAQKADDLRPHPGRDAAVASRPFTHATRANIESGRERRLPLVSKQSLSSGAEEVG